MADEFKTVSLDTMIGKRGPKKRDAFENQLGIELLGQAIQRARKERYLTQEYHCGKLSLPMPINHLGRQRHLHHGSLYFHILAGITTRNIAVKHIHPFF
jgi:hypothetical protein